MANSVVLLVIASALAFCAVSLASDPSQLQDFCVGDLASPVIVNGLACKNPNTVTPDDFFFPGLDKPGNTYNNLGSNVTTVSAAQLPGLNTLGISLARLDFAPWGLNPPHTHPRGTEILTVIEGTLEVGFVTSAPNNKLFEKVLKKGDVFVFPEGLIHFQRNVGKTNAVAISGLSSQNAGLIVVAQNLFGSNPPISDDILAKAFQTDASIVDQIKAKF